MDTKHNLRAELESARRNAELCAGRAGNGNQVQHYNKVMMELWLCEVQYLEGLLQ